MSFDPNQFLDMQITESNDTVIIPVPEGEYIAVVEKVEVRPWQSRDDSSKAGLALDIIWNIDDAAVKALLGREKILAKQGIMLDLQDSGGLDMGKGRNVGLGRLREAIGMNTPGQPFAFSMIPGNIARVKVKHRVVDDKIYAEVREVAKA